MGMMRNMPYANEPKLTHYKSMILKRGRCLCEQVKMPFDRRDKDTAKHGKGFTADVAKSIVQQLHQPITTQSTKASRNSSIKWLKNKASY